MRFQIIIALVLLVGYLVWRFPYMLHDEENLRRFLTLSAWLLFIGLTTQAVKRENLSRHLRDGMIWFAVLGLLVVLYSFRDTELGRRITGEIIPANAREGRDGTLHVRASENGHFFIEAKVNGSVTRFMVDTGASDIVLSPDDARRAGIDTAALSFDRSYNTANGFGSGAAVTIDTLSIGSLSLSRLPASVNKADMDTSLLGMSFLKRFQSFRIEGNTLVLTP